jgi:hypothetical protein
VAYDEIVIGSGGGGAPTNLTSIMIGERIADALLRSADR